MHAYAATAAARAHLGPVHKFFASHGISPHVTTGALEVLLALIVLGAITAGVRKVFS